VIALLVVAAGCGPRPELGPLDPDPKNEAVFATFKCEVPNADGERCDKKTCKKDSKSNCEYFAERCLKTGHHYSGTSDEGTCTRVAP
jgi:hypothetical protein